MTTLAIKLDPSSYMGYELAWRESYDDKNSWSAKKGAEWIFADTPKQLLAKIDESMVVTKRLKKPIKALWTDDYGPKKMEPVLIHTVCRNSVYFRRADGDEKTFFLSDLQPGKDRCKKFIHCNKANDALLKKGNVLMNKSKWLAQQAAEMLKGLSFVTDADVLIAAEEQ